MTLRLYLDEDISPVVGELLRRRGLDTVSAHDVGALKLSDEEQLERATADNRAIVSYNYIDFNLLAVHYFESDRRHAGILVAYRQFTNDQADALAESIRAFLAALPAGRLANNFLTLPPSRH